MQGWKSGGGDIVDDFFSFFLFLFSDFYLTLLFESHPCNSSGRKKYHTQWTPLKRERGYNCFYFLSSQRQLGGKRAKNLQSKKKIRDIK